ncbi:unnamed protein product, partial [Sphacelaria rigidula]
MQTAAAGGPDMIQTATTMWRKEGLRSFVHGLVPSIWFAALAHAATFIVYEASMEVI